MCASLAGPTTEGSFSVDIRGLTYADLPRVIAIERRAFPTPWSLAMFVLELSKASGVCLAALHEERLAGYLICSRYDTVWHVMNIAVDVEHQHKGVASALLGGAVRASAGRQRPLHAGGSPLQRRGDSSLRTRRLPCRGLAPALLPGQRRGRVGHVAHAGNTGQARSTTCRTQAGLRQMTRGVFMDACTTVACTGVVHAKCAISGGQKR